jgi:hypothetical protein
LQYQASAITGGQNENKHETTQLEHRLVCKVRTKSEADPMTNFMYALKAKESKRQYPRRFKMFLDLDLDGATTINEQAKILLRNTENDPKWTEQKLMEFISFQLQRVTELRL